MPQKLHTKDRGTFTFERTFANSTMHIGKLVGGGYSHLAGQPIKNLGELRAVIPDGPELVAALEWFNNRGKEKPEEKPKKRVIVTNTGFAFEDGPITSAQDILNNVAPGPMQENILGWWGTQLKDVQKAKRKEESRVSRTVDQIRQELGEKTANEQL
jgi:hypothetical protein